MEWDITLPHRPHLGVYYRLYMIIDVYNHYVVGWIVIVHNQAELAEHLIAQTRQQLKMGRDQPTLHADLGSSILCAGTTTSISTQG